MASMRPEVYMPRPPWGVRVDVATASIECDDGPSTTAYRLWKGLDKASPPLLALLITGGHPLAWVWLVLVLLLSRVRPGRWTMYEPTEDELRYAAEVRETLLDDGPDEDLPQKDPQ